MKVGSGTPFPAKGELLLIFILFKRESIHDYSGLLCPKLKRVRINITLFSKFIFRVITRKLGKQL